MMAVSSVPEFNDWIRLTARFAAAGAIALLGYHATDCPANCPGTDDRGRPRPWPQTLCTVLLLALMAIAIATACAGCTAPNPAAGTGDPPAPAYVVSPSLGPWSNAVVGAAQQAAPVVPGGPLLPEAAAAVFALIGAISVAVARSKSRQAAALNRAVARTGTETARTVIESAHPADDAATMRETINRALAMIQTDQPPPAAAAPPTTRDPVK